MTKGSVIRPNPSTDTVNLAGLGGAQTRGTYYLVLRGPEVQLPSYLVNDIVILGFGLPVLDFRPFCDAKD